MPIDKRTKATAGDPIAKQGIMTMTLPDAKMDNVYARDIGNTTQRHEMHSQFDSASRRVTDKMGMVDGGLKQGQLLNSQCVTLLLAASRHADAPPIADDADSWTPEEVKLVSASAKFDSAENNLDAIYIYSAKEFLNTCAKLGLGIWFDE